MLNYKKLNHFDVFVYLNQFRDTIVETHQIQLLSQCKSYDNVFKCIQTATKDYPPTNQNIAVFMWKSINTKAALTQSAVNDVT